MSNERVPLIDALAEILDGYENLNEADQRGHIEKLFTCVLEIAADADACVKGGCGESLLRKSLQAYIEHTESEITSLVRDAAERQGASVRTGSLRFPGIGPAGGIGGEA